MTILDEDTAADITRILRDNAVKANKCVIVVTHSPALAAMADYQFSLKKGLLQSS